MEILPEMSCVRVFVARRRWPLIASVLIFGALLCTAQPVAAQFIQQGPGLTGSGAVSSPVPTQQGNSVALSADGNTMVIGGINDNDGTGAVWFFTRSNGVWSEQAKFVPADELGQASFGASVALSADGDTALVGGPGDDGEIGGAWVLTRNDSMWSEQAKLVAGGSIGNAGQGSSVALSADGNTALLGGPIYNNESGAAWIFTRSGETWTQQTGNITPNDMSGHAAFAISAALSPDGNTAVIGGSHDNSAAGAVWVFTQSGGVWTQQGSKLVGTGAVNSPDSAGQGISVAVSLDGNTIIEGGNFDNGLVGAAWVFTQSGGVWTQQGGKLVGSGGGEFGSSVVLSSDGNTAVAGGPANGGNAGAVWVFARRAGVWNQQGSSLVGGGPGPGAQGSAVAVSADGNTIAEGGPNYNNNLGAVWPFARAVPINTHDFNDDGVSDILWRQNGSGELAMWLMSSGQLSSGVDIAQVPSIWSVVGTRDFNSDGEADILWLDNVGDVAIWLMNGPALSSGINLGNVGTQWSVVGTGDFSRNGTGDILWRNTSTGELAIWLMSGGQFSSGVELGGISTVWQVVGTGDFNGDGTTDILWRNTQTGDLAIWLMQNGQFSSGVDLGTVPLTWTVVGTGDFNGGGTSDILWRDSSGNLAIWLMSNGQFSSGATVAAVPTNWSVAEIGDFNGDGTSDILWIDQSGDLAVWLMSGLSVSAYDFLGNVGTTWQVQGQNAD